MTVGQGRGSVEELYLGDELRDQGGRDERHGELETVYHGKEELAGERELQVSVSYLVGDTTTIKSLLGKVGATVSLSWKMRDDAADTMGGDAILTSCKISGTRGNLVQGSFSFKGTGELA